MLGDASVAKRLLRRAVAVLAPDDPQRLELLVDLTEIHFVRGEFADAAQANDELARGAERVGSDDLRWRGTLDRSRLAVLAGEESPQRSAIEAAIRHFEAVGDDRALGMGWLLLATLDLHVGHMAASRQSNARAAEHSRRAGDLYGEARARIGVTSSDMDGPATVAQAVRTAGDLIDWARSTEQLGTEAIALAHLGRLRAMQGDVDEARRLVTDAIAINRDLGRTLHEANDVSRWIGTVEWLAGDPVAAELGLRRGYEQLEGLGARLGMAFVGAELARMLYLQGRFDEAYEYTLRAERYDIGRAASTAIYWRGVRALVLARRGQLAAALELSRQALAIAESTDLLWIHGRALEDEAEVLTLSGRADEARQLTAEAIRLYEQKGITVLAERARRRLAG